ncbi:E3 ubiquitin-protein ligase E3D [Trichomycterus rosablanca]|uniref:E3 ubiquitin-protein ligase E3D n=1 Tax=Trichomycterus rosablanca TaxID=2290929 RepID=UPI002F355B3A
MEKITNQELIFVELRQRLQSGLLIIRSDIVKDGVEVNVAGEERSFKIILPDAVCEVKLPQMISLAEWSFPKLNDDGLYIRLRLKVDQFSEASDSVIEHLSPQRKYCFLCQSCATILLKDKVFKRVLPLPNGNWNTLVDDWCCHPDPFANKKLLPRQEDCLLGDTYYLLNRDSSCEETLINEMNSSFDVHSGKVPVHRNVEVLCKKCNAVLGEAVTADVLKFYMTEVVVRKQEDETRTIIQHRKQFLERAIASKLIELSSAQCIFRFSIQTPDGKAAIMLWLLNTDTLIASLSQKAISSDGLNSSSNCHLDEQQSCQAVNAIKVLYLPCTPGEHQEDVNAWEKDISVHPLILPHGTCEEILQLLSSSNKALPSSLCSMNCYQVAYLRR